MRRMSDPAQPLTFRVDGDPVAEPRARARIQQGTDGRAFVRMHPSPKPRAWKQRVRAAFLDALRAQNLPMPGPGAPFVGRDGAVAVSLCFVFERPASHRTARGGLTRSAPPWPSRRGVYDVDNLAKAVLDALGPWQGPALAWEDDSLVVRLEVAKCYAVAGAAPGCTVSITPLPG